VEWVYLRVVPGITNPQQLRAPNEPPTTRVTAVQWDPPVITAAFAAILLFLGSLVFIFHVI
jgi:hypothetical protein